MKGRIAVTCSVNCGTNGKTLQLPSIWKFHLNQWVRPSFHFMHPEVFTILNTMDHLQTYRSPIYKLYGCAAVKGMVFKQFSLGLGTDKTESF